MFQLERVRAGFLHLLGVVQPAAIGAAVEAADNGNTTASLHFRMCSR